MVIRQISTAIVGALVLAASSWANAIPTLQLGIAGGTYYLTTETIIASSSNFSLYAYLIGNSISDIYTVSMAVSPQVSAKASTKAPCEKHKSKQHNGNKECTTVHPGELDIVEKAPFSYDAQSGPGDGGGGNEVPEPGSMFLLGLGLFGLGWTRWKM